MTKEEWYLAMKNENIPHSELFIDGWIPSCLTEEERIQFKNGKRKKILGLQSKLIIIDDFEESTVTGLPVEQGKIGQSFEEFLKEYPIQTERKENEGNS